ncbi:MAG: hypothetical protein WC003_16680, partial [Terrimicrobiaceae bacterium]
MAFASNAEISVEYDIDAVNTAHAKMRKTGFTGMDFTKSPRIWHVTISSHFSWQRKGDMEKNLANMAKYGDDGSQSQKQPFAPFAQ